MAVVMSKGSKKDNSELNKASRIQSSLQELQECFVDIQEVIEGEQKKPSKTDDNVVYIAPFIVREFDSLKEIPMPVEQVVSLYLEWAEKLYIVAALNRGKYKSRAVRAHMNNLFLLVKTIENMFVPTEK
jgi:predicted RNA-binding protein with EMAP domain